MQAPASRFALPLECIDCIEIIRAYQLQKSLKPGAALPGSEARLCPSLLSPRRLGVSPYWEKQPRLLHHSPLFENRIETCPFSAISFI